MRADGYVELRRFATVASAEAFATLLAAEGIECILDPSDPLLVAIASGGEGVRLLVPATQRHRAEFVLRDSEFTDEELAFLATGELPATPEEG
jgi:hypothetical protein